MIDKHSIIHGFERVRADRIAELDAECYEFIHKKSGAHLIFLDRDDENKTFAIGFKTVPTDSTGLFHILEHCVLAGSEKYPVKDPMTELLKSSLYTYLNAFTYPDKTVYPVSSKNAKAFLDLVDVYMDAVLHPLAPKNKRIFMSEGHRYEFDGDGRLTVNGIVYNEMKGAYSSPEELSDHYISESLFEGGTYAYDSGGFPGSIPSLTFEDFCKGHARFYHPENSCIFLDGRIDLDATLSLLDGYLCEYTSSGASHEIILGRINNGTRVEHYQIEEDEDPSDKTRLTIAWRGFDHSEYARHLAVTAVLDAIADTNSSPIKSRILSSGLCENMHLFYSSQSKMSTLTAQFINVKDGMCDELVSLFDKTVGDVIDTELTAELIRGSLSMLEFKTREADFGSYPRGMVYMSAAIENYFYGEAPKDAFEYDKLFSLLKSKLGSSFFADVTSEILSSERTVLIMKPDGSLAERDSAHLREELDKKQSAMTEDELTALKEEIRGFEEYLESEDSEEALAAIPTLSISDIGEPEPPAPTEIKELNAVRIIEHKMNTSGILYTEMYFDVSDIPREDMQLLRMMTLLMPDEDTEGGSAAEFRKRVKSSLGDLSVFLSPIKCDGELKLYMTVKASCLKGDADKLAALLSEYLYTVKFNDKDKLSQKLAQLYTASGESMIADGVSTCISRVSARYDTLSALREHLFGYEFHCFLKKMKNANSDALLAMLSKFENMKNEYFTRERLTLAVSADEPENVYERLIGIFKSGSSPSSGISIPLLEKRNEGLLLPSSVGYSVLGGNLWAADTDYTAALSVLSTVLTYEYLWGEIRVKGGAYDTGAISRSGSGTIACYSYRDPTPAQSVKKFVSVGDETRRAVARGIDIEKYVISTLGSQDTVTTPRSSSAAATLLTLAGKGEEYTKRVRAEILGTDRDELIRLSEVLDRVYADATFCIAGSRDMLDSAEVILEI